MLDKSIHSVQDVILWTGRGWALSTDLETKYLSVRWTGDYRCEGGRTKRKSGSSRSKTRLHRKHRNTKGGRNTSPGNVCGSERTVGHGSSG